MVDSPPFRYLAISDRGVCPDPIPDRCNRLAELGVPGLQVRDKEASDRERWNCIENLREHEGTSVLVNGRIDVAILGGLDGLHLPSSSPPVTRLRPLTDRSLIVGQSTHTIDEVREASRVDLDYVLFGPVFPTPSKPDRGEDDIPGLRGLERAADASSIPVLALGGVTPGRVRPCLDAGADGVAGIRALFGPEDPRENWTKIQETLRNEG